MENDHIPRFVNIDCLEKCPIHPQNFVIYYCDIHDDIGCYECISTSHGACAIKNIDDIAEGTQWEFEYKSILEELTGLKSFTEQNITEAEKGKLHSDICLSTVLHDIRTFKADITAHLEQMEREVSAEAKQMNLDFRIAMNEIIDKSKTIRENVEHLLDEIKEYEAKRTKLFIKLKQRKTEILRYRHETERCRGSQKMQAFVFRPNTKLTDLFRTTNSFGVIVLEDEIPEKEERLSENADSEVENTETEDKENFTAAKDVQSVDIIPVYAEGRVSSEVVVKPETEEIETIHDKAQEQLKTYTDGMERVGDELEDIKPYTGCKINAKLLSDKMDCDISGIDMLTENELVLADYNNRSVKVVDLEEGKIKDEIKLDFHPYDLTVPKTNTIAVTLTNTIQLIHRSYLFRLGENITVDGECYGVASSKEKLFVSFVKPSPKLEILNLQGDVLQRLELGTFRGRDFKRPRYISVCPNETFVYVTDFETDSIVQVSMTNDQLKIVKVFSDAAILNGPYGIHVDANGHVFVCNYGNDDIYEFSADLSRHKMVLSQSDGIESPQAIYKCDKHRNVVVACTDSADCNQIQVFSHFSELEHGD